MAKRRRGAPAAKRMPIVMAASMSVLPKSPSMRTRTIITPATGSSGRSRRDHESIGRSLRVSRDAPQTTSASLANSEGWRRNGPTISIQLRCPATSTPMTSTATRSPNATRKRIQAKPRQNGTEVRATTSMATTPTTANSPCRWTRV
jgi:hypothetical protein